MEKRHLSANLLPPFFCARLIELLCPKLLSCLVDSLNDVAIHCGTANLPHFGSHFSIKLSLLFLEDIKGCDIAIRSIIIARQYA